MQIRQYADEQLAATGAADVMASRLRNGVEERGLATVALSGGSTPKLMYAALVQLELPWRHIHVFQVDERVAPESAEARNGKHIVELLLSQIEIPPDNWHPMPASAAPLEQAAVRYAEDLASTCNGSLDVVHLGLGDDGHTASWPPGDDAILSATSDVGWVRHFRDFDRLTLTPQAVNEATTIVWLVTGASKRSVLSRWEAQDPDLPSSHVRRNDSDVLVIDAHASADHAGLTDVRQQSIFLC